MNNIVDLGAGRSRPRRSVEMERDGAIILFFTGVRYERPADDEAAPFVTTPEGFHDHPALVPLDHSEVALDLAIR